MGSHEFSVAFVRQAFFESSVAFEDAEMRNQCKASIN